MARYAMAVDLSRCMGCRACMEACKVENNTPAGIFWMHVFRFEEGRYPRVKFWFLPRPCMHCDNAPCVKVCPVGARYKREDGPVVTDAERCIGCRYCQVACPYGVNYFNWKDPVRNQYFDWLAGEGRDVLGEGSLDRVTGTWVPPYANPDLRRRHGQEKRRIAGGGHFKGVMEKCTFCVHRVERGLLPACAANCPMSALIFGDLDDPESEVSVHLSNNHWFRLAEEYGTEPRVFYTGAQAPGSHLQQEAR